MIIYEVNLSVSKSISCRFEKWLNSHAKSMLIFPGFTKFVMYNVSSNNKNKINLCIHYYIKSESYLEEYLINNADKMRKEGLDLFKNKFTSNRRILTLWD